MMDKYGVNEEVVKTNLDRLIVDGRVTSAREDGVTTTYNTTQGKLRKARPDTAPPLDDTMRQISIILQKCIREINQVSEHNY